VVRLAHGLGALVVAEGVESHAQLEALRKLGCDTAQGYLLGRPQPAAGITRLLEAKRLTQTLAIPA
jgi:EAL domain-containing protein (putative c-di-GMP-specific phosphodiesterase class I)